MHAFDDYLRLGRIGTPGPHLVVFCGASGSGKSTYLEHLRTAWTMPLGRGSCLLRTGYTQGEVHAAFAMDVYLDEVTAVRQLRDIFRLLRQGNRVFVASHVAPACYAPFRLLWRVETYRTDRDTGKIARYLATRGVRSSMAAVESYCREYGATYTDVDIVLERMPGLDFDTALVRFRRHCSIAFAPASAAFGRLQSTERR